MKKLIGLFMGACLLVSTATVTFAQDAPKQDSKGKGDKKGGDKKDGDKKEDKGK